MSAPALALAAVVVVAVLIAWMVVRPPAPLAPGFAPLTPGFAPLTPGFAPLAPGTSPLGPATPSDAPLSIPSVPLAPTVTIYGIGGDSTLYSVSPPETSWSAAAAMPTRLSAVAYNQADGRVYGLDDNLELWFVNPKTGGGGVVPGGDPPGDKLSSIAFDGAGGMWGVTINGALVTKGTNYAAKWTVAAPVLDPAGAIFNVAFDAAGVMWGVARRTGLVYKKASHNLASPWAAVQAAGATPVNNIHIDHDSGWFYGVGGAWQLYGSPDLMERPWSAAPVSSGEVVIQDIAVAPLGRASTPRS